MILFSPVHLVAGGRTAFLLTTGALAVVAMLLSSAVFIADQFGSSAIRQLDDPETEHRDLIDLSDRTLPVYVGAIKTLERARSAAPLAAGYESGLGELSFRIALWKEAMSEMTGQGRTGRATIDQWYSTTLARMENAVRLDPANAQLRLSLGRIATAMGDRERARRELQFAVEGAPASAAVRYLAALQLLILGMTTEAGEEARVLARIDDSYRLNDDDPRTVAAREGRTSFYEARLTSSYLFKALEILWRTSGADRETVRSAVPDHVDARATLRLFEKHRGIDDRQDDQ